MRQRNRKRIGRRGSPGVRRALIVTVGIHRRARCAASAPDITVKERRVNIEPRAADKDTGFQGAIDSEGWQQLDVTRPRRPGPGVRGPGIARGQLGVTELFFETVEPENADVPIDDMLAELPEGDYTISGPAQENGVQHRPDVRDGAADARHPEGPEAREARRGRDVDDDRSGRQVEAGEQDDHGRPGEDHRLSS